MPQVGLEPMIPVFEWEKTFHALDRMATVIGTVLYTNQNLGDTLTVTHFKYYKYKLRAFL
jgi:hypothetical protein